MDPALGVAAPGKPSLNQTAATEKTEMSSVGGMITPLLPSAIPEETCAWLEREARVLSGRLARLNRLVPGSGLALVLKPVHESELLSTLKKGATISSFGPGGTLHLIGFGLALDPRVLDTEELARLEAARSAGEHDARALLRPWSSPYAPSTERRWAIPSGTQEEMITAVRPALHAWYQELQDSRSAVELKVRSVPGGQLAVALSNLTLRGGATLLALIIGAALVFTAPASQRALWAIAALVGVQLLGALWTQAAISAIWKTQRRWARSAGVRARLQLLGQAELELRPNHNAAERLAPHLGRYS